jgi:hypothetical protein
MVVRVARVSTSLLITYEAGIDEPIHPDPTVRSRLFEAALSNCEYGCKIYGDPDSAVLILAHNSTYGCTRKAEDVQADH